MGEDFDKGRREFLKQSVLSVGKTVYEYYQQQKETPSETGPKEPPVKVRTDWLRPPGAVAEELFGDRPRRPQPIRPDLDRRLLRTGLRRGLFLLLVVFVDSFADRQDRLL